MEQEKKLAQKGPRTAYIIFCEHQRPVLVKENPTLSVREQLHELATRWKKSGARVRITYKKLCEEERKRYEEEERKELELLCAENNETLNEATKLLYACKYNKPTLAKYFLDKCQQNVENTYPSDDAPESNDNYFKYEPWDCLFSLNEDNIFVQTFFQCIDSENPLTYACKNNMIAIASQWLDIKNNIYDTYGEGRGGEGVTSIVSNNINDGSIPDRGYCYYLASGSLNNEFKKLEAGYFRTALHYMLQNNISGLLHKLVTNYVYYEVTSTYDVLINTPNDFDEKLILDEKILSRSTKNTKFLKDYNELIDSYINKTKKHYESDIQKLEKELNDKRKNLEKAMEEPMKLKSRLSNWEPRNEIIKFRQTKRTAAGLGK